jgi:hypothetical protein
MGVFYVSTCQSRSCDWLQYTTLIPQHHAFAVKAPARTSTASKFDINIDEITVILRAFEKWAQRWKTKHVIVHSDNTTAEIGLVKSSLKSPEQNEPLRKILLLAAANDITIEAVRIRGEDNGLADALSRDLQDKIANWCPHWQKSCHSLNLQKNF